MRGPEGRRGETRAITSLSNERVKLIRALALRKARRETGLFVAEGAALAITARAAGWQPTMLVFLAGSTRTPAVAELVGSAQRAGAECLEVSEAVLAKLAGKDNPQTLLAVFAQRWQNPPATADLAGDALWLALEAPRDPGNLGSIMRSLDAVGGSGLIIIGQGCDPYSREAVRASMGSIFNVAITHMEREPFVAWRAHWPGDVVGTHLEARLDFRRAVYRAPLILLMGSEGPGLSPELSRACSRLVKIPMAGRLDSLNLAIATGLMLYGLRKAILTL